MGASDLPSACVNGTSFAHSERNLAPCEPFPSHGNVETMTAKTLVHAQASAPLFKATPANKLESIILQCILTIKRVTGAYKSYILAWVYKRQRVTYQMQTPTASEENEEYVDYSKNHNGGNEVRRGGGRQQTTGKQHSKQMEGKSC